MVANAKLSVYVLSLMVFTTTLSIVTAMLSVKGCTAKWLIFFLFDKKLLKLKKLTEIDDKMNFPKDVFIAKVVFHVFWKAFLFRLRSMNYSIFVCVSNIGFFPC